MAEANHFELSVVIDGATFSARGEKAEVLRLYHEWRAMAGLDEPSAPINRKPFNGPLLRPMQA